MGVISTIKTLNNSDIQTAFKVSDTTTTEMQTRLDMCRQAYYRAIKSVDKNAALNLPFTIVNKLTKTMFSECTITANDDFYKDFIKQVNKKKTEIMSKLLYGGSVILKPYVTPSDKLGFVVVARENYIPVGRDFDGNLIEVILSEVTEKGACYYTLLEKRKITNNGCLIEYKLFESEIKGVLGKQINLSYLYSDMPESFMLDTDSLGLIEIKTPLLNDIDTSRDGIPVFEPALEIIDLCNENEAQLKDEFKLGQSRIIVSDDMFRKNSLGEPVVTDKVFVSLDLDPAEQSGSGITIFNPELREQSYIARKNEYLRAIESVIGLQRGLLSDVNQQEKTAKEIGSSEASYNLTIVDFQNCFKTGIEELAGVWADFGKIYKIKGAKDYEDELISFDFGDGVLYNRDKVFSELLGLCAAGLIKGEVVVAWYYDIDLSTPEGEEAVKKYMPELDEMLKDAVDDED